MGRCTTCKPEVEFQLFLKITPLCDLRHIRAAGNRLLTLKVQYGRSGHSHVHDRERDGAREFVDEFGAATMARVFISHSRRDKEPAERIEVWLNEQGFEAPFLD